MAKIEHVRRSSSILAIRVRSVETLNFVEKFNCLTFLHSSYLMLKSIRKTELAMTKKMFCLNRALVDAIKHFWRKSRFTKNYEIEKSFITLTSGAETVTLTVNHTIVISFNLCV